MQYFQKGATGPITFPVTSLAPLYPSELHSPRIGKAHGLKLPAGYNVEELAQETLEVRLRVERDEYPIDFLRKYYPFGDQFGELEDDITQPLKDAFLRKQKPQQLAQVVHMDFPTDLPKYVFRYLLRQGYDVVGHTGQYVHFLETIPAIEKAISDQVAVALSNCFEAKYYFGVARPEEVTNLGAIMTAYPEGCPNHPEHPQGHGAAAGGGCMALIDNFQALAPEHLKVVLDTAYLWGQFRCFAGVHYGPAVIASLILCGYGQWMDEGIVSDYTN